MSELPRVVVDQSAADKVAGSQTAEAMEDHYLIGYMSLTEHEDSVWGNQANADFIRAEQPPIAPLDPTDSCYLYEYENRHLGRYPNRDYFYTVEGAAVDAGDTVILSNEAGTWRTLTSSGGYNSWEAHDDPGSLTIDTTGDGEFPASSIELPDNR